MREIITIDDIIRNGACVSGAYEALRRVAKTKTVAAAMTVDAALALAPKSEADRLLKAAGCNGDGDDYGDGDGDGDGYGNGDGNGNGDGEP